MSLAAQDTPDGSTGRARAWEAAWAQRQALLRTARRRSASAADAEDAVSEAITRSAETAELDTDRLGAWLAAVTTRLCVDDARERARQPKRIAYQVRQGTSAEDHADAVCDRAEAGWLAGHLAALPERQSQALGLRADGLEVSGIAEVMGISDKAAEGLLLRARTTLREVLSSALGWAVLVLTAVVGVTRRRAAAGATAVAAAGISTVLAVVHLPSPPAGAGPGAGPAASAPLAPARRSSEEGTDAGGRRPPVPAVERVPAAAGPEAPAATAGTAPTAAPAPAGSTRRYVVEPRTVEVQGWTVHDGGYTTTDSDEPMKDRVERCLREGPVVSTTLIGCRPSDDPSRQEGSGG